jgi:hypothetical protein
MRRRSALNECIAANALSSETDVTDFHQIKQSFSDFAIGGPI